MNPIRKPTYAGTTQEYNYDLITTQFLVKNMSGGDIRVSFERDGDENWLVPDGAWQVIPGSENRIRRQKIYVYADESSALNRGVEIEAIEYELPRKG